MPPQPVTSFNLSGPSGAGIAATGNIARLHHHRKDVHRSPCRCTRQAAALRFSHRCVTTCRAIANARHVWHFSSYLYGPGSIRERARQTFCLAASALWLLWIKLGGFAADAGSGRCPSAQHAQNATVSKLVNGLTWAAQVRKGTLKCEASNKGQRH